MLNKFGLLLIKQIQTNVRHGVCPKTVKRKWKDEELLDLFPDRCACVHCYMAEHSARLRMTDGTRAHSRSLMVDMQIDSSGFENVVQDVPQF